MIWRRKRSRFLDQGGGSYYTNSQGCANCSSSELKNPLNALSRVFVVDIESNEVRWFRNSVAHFKDTIYANEANRLVGYRGLKEVSFGAVPFNLGQLNVSADQSKAITISRADFGNSIATQHKSSFGIW